MMPQVYICNRCTEKIDADKQDWAVISMDTAGISGLETRAHADCEVRRLKDSQAKSMQASRHSSVRPIGVDQAPPGGRTRTE
jgi:hypothetical protein